MHRYLHHNHRHHDHPRRDDLHCDHLHHDHPHHELGDDDRRYHAEPRGRGGHGGRGRHGEGPGRGWGGGREEGHRGRRGVFDSAELRLVLLKLIAEQSRHGYDLIRAIEDLSGGGYAPSPGVVYPTLTLLQDMGLIEEAQSAGPRKAFAITAEGTETLTAQADILKGLFERLAEITAAHERTDGGPVRRAMSNLKMALMQRLRREDVTAEQIHAAAAIIDEAAQRIDRL